MPRVRTFTENSLWLIVSAASVMLVGAVYRPIIGRMLGPSEYGQYTFIQTYAMYFLVIAYFGIRSVITREVGRDPSKVKSYVSACLRIRAVTSVLAVILCCSIGLALNRGHQVTTGIFVMSLSFLALAVSELFEGVLVAFHRSFHIAVCNIIGNLVKLGTGVWALHAGYGLIGVLWTYVAASTLTTALIWWFLREVLSRGKDATPDPSVSRYVMKESFPFVILFLAGKVYAKNDILLLSLMKGDLATGLYGAAYVFIDMLVGFGNCVTMAAYPMLAQIHVEQDDKVNVRLPMVYQRLHKHLLMIFLPISVVLAVLGQKVLVLVFGSHFSTGAALIPFILAWVPSTEVSSMVSGNFLSATNRQSTEAKIAVFAGALGVVWTAAFIWLWGAVGAAVATLGASIVHAATRSLFVQRYIGKADLIDAYLKPLVCAAALFAGIMVGDIMHSGYISAAIGALFYAAAFAVSKPYDKYDRQMIASALKKK